jgi:DNA-binding NtrC family response regulator
MDKKNVLLVDDEPEWLDFGHSSLTKAGYSVEFSTSIKNAMLLCQDKRFSLVLVDFNIMEKDEDLFRGLISQLKKRYVVVLSPMDLSPKKLRKAFNLGAFDCVEKCYDTPALQQLVEKQLMDIQRESKREGRNNLWKKGIF